jgi:flagellar protein FlaG
MTISPISSSIPAVVTARSAGATQPATDVADPAVTAATSDGSIAAVKAASATPSRDQIDQAMEEMKQALPAVARNLQFSIDNDTGQTVVKVVDTSTKEVIRQIPSEELIAITKALDTFTGLLVKQKV